MDALKHDRTYTYADWLEWPEGERWEIIDGAAHMMSAPSVVHQRISRELLVQLAVFLKGKQCEAFGAPIGVRLSDDVFEPDIVVVCDKTKLTDGKVCNGAPDIIVEILSPSTAGKDRLEKFNKYLRSGVREYWIVDPESKVVNINVLENGKYINNAYGKTDAAPVHVLSGCVIDLTTVFSET